VQNIKPKQNIKHSDYTIINIILSMYLLLSLSSSLSLSLSYCYYHDITI